MDQFTENSGFQQFPEAGVNSREWPIAIGEISPRSTTAKNPDDAIQDLSVIGPGAATFAVSRFSSW